MTKRSVKGGLKTKGMRTAPMDKLAKQENESASHAKHDQMYGAGAKKVKCDHVAMGNAKKPE